MRQMHPSWQLSVAMQLDAESCCQGHAGRTIRNVCASFCLTSMSNRTDLLLLWPCMAHAIQRGVWLTAGLFAVARGTSDQTPTPAMCCLMRQGTWREFRIQLRYKRKRQQRKEQTCLFVHETANVGVGGCSWPSSASQLNRCVGTGEFNSVQTERCEEQQGSISVL